MITFILLVILALVTGSCHNHCSGNGVCNKYGLCECFTTHTGYDCSERQCPMGPTIGQIPDSRDSAHTLSICSGRGDCDHKAGLCSCYPGFRGPNCGQMYCFNNCNGRGECVSLGVAATAYDGYRFNRSTTYTQWDANMFHGCKCDVGWGGADCSERICEYGVDPRLSYSANYHELVTMVCDCTPICQGKFKVRLMGQTAVQWLKSSATTHDLQAALTTISGKFAKNKVYSYAQVASVNGSGSGFLCQPNAETKTIIKFRKTTAESPMMSFYANLIFGGSLYFESKQTLVCDCTSHSCNGTFRLSFDGEMSARLQTWGNGTDIVKALRAMKTVAAAGAWVANTSVAYPVCRNGKKMNHTIVFHGPAGNLPRMGLWSSVVPYNKPNKFSTANTSRVLQLVTSDGRDDSVQLCNGIGTCDFKAGICNCPFGWGPDAELGPCGQLVINASSFPGIGRCPGVVEPGDSQGIHDLTGRRNYHRVYMAMNPLTIMYSIVLEGVRHHNKSVTVRHSVIQYFEWQQGLMSNTFSGPGMNVSSGTIMLNMTSNVSAGPLFLDQSRQQIFFVDLNPAGMFIGLAPMQLPVNATESTPRYRKWLTVTRAIFGLTADARADRRVLYWTTPGAEYVADGSVQWAHMDEYPVVAHSLVAAVGAQYIVDPMGIAVHHSKRKLYWIDKNTTVRHAATVLRSCNFDGSGYLQVYLYRKVDNHTVSVNATDLVIDFFHNDTAFIVDAGQPAAIVTTNLDFPHGYNDTNAGDRFMNMEPTRLLCDTVAITMDTPRYLALDVDITLVLWSDPMNYKVNFARYMPMFLDHFERGNAYQPAEELDVHAVYRNVYVPMGMAFDPGYGPPIFPYRDCFGRGRCGGFGGNFVCECDSGGTGNCQARTCPWARAWWSEPVVDEIAHDELLECANMGQCDRISGECMCRPGFEGSACERMLCQGQMEQFNFCSGRGRCMSLRELGQKHVDQYKAPDPVTYGALPNDPNTWDADMIMGCYADAYGYSEATGHTNITSFVGETLVDLECPYGFNMRLVDKVYANHTLSNATTQVEIQQLMCSGTSGYFTLEFRGVVSPPIFVNNTLASMQKQLLGVTSLGEVSLQSYDAVGSYGAICSSSGSVNHVNITFVSELGLVPLISVAASSITGGNASVHIRRMQTGYGPLFECSGKGGCDRNEGVCNCWDSWGSSDGFGERGTRGDCGYSLLQ